MKNILLFIGLFTFLGCNKAEFLDEKPASSIVVPTRLNELRGLLDNYDLVETGMWGLASSDEYYWTLDRWQAMQLPYRNLYLWKSDVFEGQTGTIESWSNLYRQVFYANVVLEGLGEISVTPQNAGEYYAVRGAALFMRGWAFYNLAEMFTMPYDAGTAASQLGLPLKLNSDVHDIPQRATLEDTYRQILADLTMAKQTLQGTTIAYNRIRPTKLVAYGALARIYLSMRDYDAAGKHADSVLMHYDRLIDYNTITTNLSVWNDEAFFQALCQDNSWFGPGLGWASIPPEFYARYESNDLRRNLFFRSLSDGRITTFVRGSYSGMALPFSGLATDEMYLIRAECRARNGEVSSAIEDLNWLLENRYRTGTYVSFSTTDSREALDRILLERRKELVFRGLRWSDVRRLNLEGANITMTRVLDGVTYTLPPNDPRFALPLPPDAVELSGLAQNPR